MALTDTYTIRARIQPVLLVALPMWTLVGVAATAVPLGLARLPLGAAIGAAVIGLIGELGRDRGRRMEPALWASWGGPPAMVALRWRGCGSAVMVQLWHEAVQSVIGPSLRLPTAEEEAANPTRADEVYAAALSVVIGQTRDHRRFPLVFKENVSYGFRRNVLGLRTAGLVCAIATLAIVAVVCFALGISGSKTENLEVWSIPAAAALVAFVSWLRVSGEWVRPIAEAYARRLLEGACTLSREGRGGGGSLTRSTRS